MHIYWFISKKAIDHPLFFIWLKPYWRYLTYIDKFLGLVVLMLSSWITLDWFYNFEDEYTYIYFPWLDIQMIMTSDSLSYIFILLLTLILNLFCTCTEIHEEESWEMFIYLAFLQFAVTYAFSVLDILGFFIFFEMTLIPIYLLILIFGSRERKIRASYLISIYTLFGSVFMFFNIVYLLSKFGTTNYFHLMNIQFTEFDARFLWITFFIAFAAKIPMLPFHIWLPEAHVEAPTAGSVLLAALLLKLGTYGLVRFSIKLFPEATVYFSSFINIFAILSVLYTSLTAIRQIDMKKIIAYSSVGHMNVVLLGLLVLNIENIEGAIFQMISHGIVASALFFCVDSFYSRYKVRSIDYFGGLIVTYPLLSVAFLIFSLANISFPGTSNFVGEFLIMFGLFPYNSIIVTLASLNMIIGAAYTLWAYNRVVFGNIKDKYLLKHFDLMPGEIIRYIILALVMIIIGIYPSSILNGLHEYVSYLVLIVN